MPADPMRFSLTFFGDNHCSHRFQSHPKPFPERILEKYHLKAQDPFPVWVSMQNIGNVPLIIVCDGKFLVVPVLKRGAASSASSSASDFDARNPLGWLATAFAPYRRVDELHCLLNEPDISNSDLQT